MKNLYKITVLKWFEHNSGHKKNYKKTLIANNMIHDSSLGMMPVSHRWLWLGILLTCGDHSSDTVEMTEKQLRAMLESSKSVSSALESLQSFQLLRYEVVICNGSPNRIEKNRIEKNRNENNIAPFVFRPQRCLDILLLVLRLPVLPLASLLCVGRHSLKVS